VVAAHGGGLMVLLDFVYNHFGPEGKYLHEYGRPPVFQSRTLQTASGGAADQFRW